MPSFAALALLLQIVASQTPTPPQPFQITIETVEAGRIRITRGTFTVEAARFSVRYTERGFSITSDDPVTVKATPNGEAFVMSPFEITLGPNAIGGGGRFLPVPAEPR